MSDSYCDERESVLSYYIVVKGQNRMLLLHNSAVRKEEASNETVSQVAYPYNQYGLPLISPLPPQKFKHKNNSANKSHAEVLCSGTVDAIAKVQIISEDSSVKDLVSLSIVPPGYAATSVQVPMETLHNPKLLKVQLEEKGIIIHKSEKLSYLCEYLNNQVKSLSLNVTNKGFSFTDNTIRHSNELEIFKSSCESWDCRTRFGLKDDSINLANAALLLIGSYSEIRLPLAWINHKANPVILLKCNNIDTAKDVLSKAFPNTPQIALGKRMAESLESVEENLSFIIADSASSYFAEKLIEVMDKSGSEGAAKINCLPIVVTTSDNPFKKDSDRIIRMNLDNSLGESSHKVAFWLMKRLISESGTLTLQELSQSYEKFSSMLDNDARLSDMSASLFAALLAIFDVFVSSWELEPSIRQKLIDDMTAHLIETNEGGTNSIAEKLKEILMTDVGIPVFERNKCRKITPSGIILVDSEKISLDAISFARFSELCGFEKSRGFAEALRKENLLLTDGKLQKKVSLPMAGKTENMYCLDNSKLFTFGEQLPETDEFAYCAPQVQLYLGRTTSGKPLFFTLNKADGSENANVYISGSSGSGKSTLLRQWARESARNGLETVIIDTDGQFSRTMTGDNVLVYSIGDEYCISSSASGKTLITAASACADLSTKQKNELKEISSYLNKCSSASELFEAFEQIVSDNKTSSLEEVNTAMQESGITNDKLLDWKDICCSGVISILDFSNLEVLEIKPVLDLILEELFDYKNSVQSSSINTCTLILDEVQKFRLDGKAPLASKMLRQGRKFGISTIMATQYLSSDDAINIGKLLNQCNSFCSFRPANCTDTLKTMNLKGYDGAEYCLNNLETGCAVLSGLFSTERCSIKYPVKLFVESD
ncbi:MAG: hypothetical protein ACI4JY_04140 [Oscillospiraceae bacterium]